jgi:hypothetical protein
MRAKVALRQIPRKRYFTVKDAQLSAIATALSDQAVDCGDDPGPQSDDGREAHVQAVGTQIEVIKR